MIWLALLLGCPFVTEKDQADIRDRDGDGFDAIGFGGLDCDDDDPLVNPVAEEVWYDGVDDDCDGNLYDQDGDGALGGAEGTDCDDTDPAIDDTRFERFFDGDGDGFGSVQATTCPNEPSTTSQGGDCDDSNPDVNPDADEQWYDEVDDNCDGNRYDQDGDGALGGGVGVDCDDTDPDVQDVIMYYVDFDEDGFGWAGPQEPGGCTPEPDESDNDLDCDDINPDINPDALEICDDSENGIDEDCDGFADDEDVSGPEPGNQQFFTTDNDGDGFGVTGTEVLRCDAGENSGLAEVDGDCDDEQVTQYPGAQWYLDRDRDEHGDPDNAVTSCLPVVGRVTEGDDCNDRDPSVHPGAPETLYDYVDSDCEGDTDVETTTPDHYPLPIGAWSEPPVWLDAPTSCPGYAVLEVGPGRPYASIQDAIDDAARCDIIAIDEGRYAPFTVDTEGLVITARPGDEVTIWAGAGIIVNTKDVILSDLIVEGTSTGLTLQESTFLDRMTLTDNLNNISAYGDLLVYDIEVTGGVGGIYRDSPGNLRVEGADFDGVLGLVGVINSSSVFGAFNGGEARLRDVSIRGSTGGIFAAVHLRGPRATVQGLSISGGAGQAVFLGANEVLANGIDLRENAVFDGPILRAEGSDRAILHDVRVRDNSWVFRQDASDIPAFVDLYGFGEAFVDDIQMATNLLDLSQAPTTIPVWLRSGAPVGGILVPNSTHTLHHALISGYDPYQVGDPTGVGVLFQGGTIKQATLVGLDAGLWSVRGDDGYPEVSASILWDVAELAVTDAWDGKSGGPPAAISTTASNDPSCFACQTEDPAFLRYHPLLDGALWDLRLLRIIDPTSPLASSPYYRFGEADLTHDDTCGFQQVDHDDAVSEQLGAFGNLAIVDSELQLYPEIRVFIVDQYADGFVYNDCDGDGIYDTWEVQFRAFDDAADPDMDDLDNLAEFQAGTLPILADTDGDTVQDDSDDEPLNPTFP